MKDVITQASQIAQLDSKQKQLLDQAQAITKTQAEFEKKVKIERERARRLNNEQFAKWLDNSTWALQKWCETVVFKVSWWSGDIKILTAVIAMSLFIITPVCTILSLRLLLSDRCIQMSQCRAVVMWITDIKPKSDKR